MNFILFIIVGALAGWAAGRLFKGKGFGLVGNLVVGIVGGLVGGWVFDFLGIAWGGLLGSLGTAIIGALLLLWIVSLLTK